MIELIACIFMTILVTFVISFYSLTILLDSYEKNTAMYSAIILGTAVMILCCLVHIAVSYVFYQTFDEIFVRRLGAKLIYHQMFKWYQIQHSSVKLDAGLCMVFMTIDLCFDYGNTAKTIVSGLCFIYCFVYIVLCKSFLRNEKKMHVIATLSIRAVFYLYSILCLIRLLMNFETDDTYFKQGIGKAITSVVFGLMTIFLAVIGYSTIICFGNFNKGFKVILSTKLNLSENIPDEVEDLDPHTDF